MASEDFGHFTRPLNHLEEALAAATFFLEFAQAIFLTGVVVCAAVLALVFHDENLAVFELRDEIRIEVVGCRFGARKVLRPFHRSDRGL
jgi:hypothetical protein